MVRRNHPALDDPRPERLSQLEWVLPSTESNALSDGLRQLFVQAGVVAPQKFTHCDALAAMALVSQSDAISIMPLPLLKHEQSLGLMALSGHGLQPPEVDLVQLSRHDVPLTPSAEHFAHCLRQAIGLGLSSMAPY